MAEMQMRKTAVPTTWSMRPPPTLRKPCGYVEKMEAVSGTGLQGEKRFKGNCNAACGHG